MKICAVIPAYNEQKTIFDVVKGTKKYIDDVLVVDNNSTDCTAKLAWLAGAEIIKCDKRGYGATQKTGQDIAIKCGYEYILQVDADGQHNVDDIPRMVEEIRRGDCDILVGSRFLNGTKPNLSTIRISGIKFFSKVVSILFGGKITDITSGFKIYKSERLATLHKPSDINPAVEQMAEIAKKGMKIREIPIKSNSRDSGKSHLSFSRFAIYPLRACWHIIKVWMFY